MSRLDDIRDTYFRIARKLEKPGKLEHAELSRHSTYCADIGYLLDLLEVYPASEPPELYVPVLVKILTPTGDTLYDTTSYDGEWYSVYGEVVSWCKIPPMNVEK